MGDLISYDDTTSLATRINRIARSLGYTDDNPVSFPLVTSNSQGVAYSTTATVSKTAPVGAGAGDIWYNPTNGKFQQMATQGATTKWYDLGSATTFLSREEYTGQQLMDNGGNSGGEGLPSEITASYDEINNTKGTTGPIQGQLDTLREAVDDLDTELDTHVTDLVNQKIAGIPDQVSGLVEEGLSGVDQRVDARVADATAGLPAQVTQEVADATAGIHDQVAAQVTAATSGIHDQVAAQITEATSGIDEQVAAQVAAATTALHTTISTEISSAVEDSHTAITTEIGAAVDASHAAITGEYEAADTALHTAITTEIGQAISGLQVDQKLTTLTQAFDEDLQEVKTSADNATQAVAELTNTVNALPKFQPHLVVLGSQAVEDVPSIELGPDEHGSVTTSLFLPEGSTRMHVSIGYRQSAAGVASDVPNPDTTEGQPATISEMPKVDVQLSIRSVVIGSATGAEHFVDNADPFYETAADTNWHSYEYDVIYADQNLTAGDFAIVDVQRFGDNAEDNFTGSLLLSFIKITFDDQPLANS